MKAVILAAGEGTRLRPVTYYVPKPMLPFYEKPFMEYTMQSLLGLVERVVMVVKYKQEQIREYFGHRFASLHVEYAVQQHLQGTGSAVMAARDFVNGEFLVIQGDVYASRRLLRDMMAIDHEYVLSLVEVDDPENHAGVRHQDGAIQETFTHQALGKLDQKNSDLAPLDMRSQWVDRGVWRLSHGVFDQIEEMRLSGETDEIRMLGVLQRLIDCGVHVGACLTREPWIELGDHEPLESVLKALAFFRKKAEQSDNSIASKVGTEESEIENSLIFGEGKILRSRIKNSLIYLRGVLEDMNIKDQIAVFDHGSRRLDPEIT